MQMFPYILFFPIITEIGTSSDSKGCYSIYLGYSAFLNFKADFFPIYSSLNEEFGYTVAFANRWSESLSGLKPENGWSALVQYFIVVLLRDFQKP